MLIFVAFKSLGNDYICKTDIYNFAAFRCEDAIALKVFKVYNFAITFNDEITIEILGFF
jgi:hypothetical protein